MYFVANDYHLQQNIRFTANIFIRRLIRYSSLTKSQRSQVCKKYDMQL